MAFPTNDIFLGPTSYGLRGAHGECDGIIFHTTEGGGVSRESALATAKWQATPGKTTGSYNFIIYDGGILLTVPYLEASGGVNPGSTAWAPERFSFLKTQLPSRAYLNPNEFQMNVAFSGRAAEFAKGNMPDNMITTAAQLVLWAQEQDWSSSLLVISGHQHWQTNRSDPSTPVLNKIKDRIIELSSNNPFNDIDNSIFKADIIKATQAGIFTVPADGKFNPKGTVTREQLAAVVSRMLEEKAKNE